MHSTANDADLTARAGIRNGALRLFAERGHDAVTVREIAAAAGVSPGLVVHHFGSKDGLRAAVDAHAADSFDAIFTELDAEHLPEMLIQGGATPTIAEAFARTFPPDSPLPAYLRRLLLTEDPAGSALFSRWFAASRGLLDAMVELGAARPTEDRAVRAAFLLTSDLALILLRNQIAAAIGEDPLSRPGLDRWAKDVTAIYLGGAFTAPVREPPS